MAITPRKVLRKQPKRMRLVWTNPEAGYSGWDMESEVTDSSGSSRMYNIEESGSWFTQNRAIVKWAKALPLQSCWLNKQNRLEEQHSARYFVSSSRWADSLDVDARDRQRNVAVSEAFMWWMGIWNVFLKLIPLYHLWTGKQRQSFRKGSSLLQEVLLHCCLLLVQST